MHSRRIPPESTWQARYEDSPAPDGVWEVQHVGGGIVTLAKGDEEIEVGVRRFFDLWERATEQEE